MSERSNEWSIQNGTFVGQVLCDAEPVHEPGKMARKGGDAWLRFAIDLRDINHIKQRKPDDDGNCCLYHNDVFVATVNCSFAELLPHWLKWRHLYDRNAPYRDPGDETPPFVIGQPPRL